MAYATVLVHPLTFFDSPRLHVLTKGLTSVNHIEDDKNIRGILRNHCESRIREPRHRLTRLCRVRPAIPHNLIIPAVDDIRTVGDLVALAKKWDQ